MKRILVLDDSDTIRAQLNTLLTRWGYLPLLAATTSEAEVVLAEGIDFAIVDVYLDGACGEQLSAEFIRNHLEPAAIPYGRFTSAPESVPVDQRGLWVLHKYDVRQDPSILLDALTESCGPSN